MLTPVEFNDQPHFLAKEIDNVAKPGMLPSELRT
jgi:hypothetical protein